MRLELKVPPVAIELFAQRPIIVILSEVLAGKGGAKEASWSEFYTVFSM